MISWTTTKALADSLGVQLDRLKAALGTGSETGSVSKAAATNLGRIQALASATGGNDPASAADLLPSSVQHKTRVIAAATNREMYQFLAIDVNGLEQHLKGNSTTLNAQAAGATERFSPSFAELYRALNGNLDADNVFPPVTQLGTFLASGAGAGTFTDGSAVDDTKYGGADIEAEATATCSSVVITAVGIDVDGGSTNCTGTLNGASGTKVDLVAANGKKIVNVSSVTITGGGAGNAFKIQTKLDRTPAE